ncbi:MAG TPA: helix-turn-helix transcriptional regulator [Candidatus Paceibacterota bacterium]|nr:helix-turn-helix transcriptional regulator [Candidatus Paceibacterota bacterium]
MKKDLRKTLSENVVAFRRANGLSQDAFASLCGLHRTYIGSVERCERNVTLATLELLAGAMRVSAADLLKERSEK